jgi:hypothetical protein
LKLASGRVTGLKLKENEKRLWIPMRRLENRESKAKPDPRKQMPFELIHMDLLVGAVTSLGESIRYHLMMVESSY